MQRKLVPASLLAALGLAAAGAAPFLPWVKVNAALSILGGRNLELKGIDLAQGKALVGMGVIGVVAALLTAVSSGARRVGGLVVVIAASMAVGFGATDIVDVLRVPEVNLSIQGLPTSLPTGLPSGFPTALPTSFPSFPFPFPTSFPSLFPSGFPFPFPTESGSTSPAAFHLPATSLPQATGAGFAVDVGIGLWMVAGGGLLALLMGIALALPRTRSPIVAPVAPPFAGPPPPAGPPPVVGPPPAAPPAGAPPAGSTADRTDASGPHQPDRAPPAGAVAALAATA